MRNRGAVLVAVSAVLLASPLAAQRRGSVEVGGFVGYANYDNTLPLGNLIGNFGGRIGVHVLPVLAVEFDVATAKKNDVTATPMHFWLVYTVPPVSHSEVIVGGGYVRNKYTGAYEAKDNGIAGFFGVRHRVGNMFAVRLDGHTDFVPSPANKSHQSSFNGNWGIQLGFSVLLNRGSGAAAPVPGR